MSKVSRRGGGEGTIDPHPLLCVRVTIFYSRLLGLPVKTIPSFVLQNAKEQLC